MITNAHVAIDRDVMRVVGTGDYRALSVLSVVQERPNVDIIYAGENKSFAIYAKEQLVKLYLGLTDTPFHGEYWQLLEAIRALIARIAPVPFTEEQLTVEAEKRLGPEVFDRPPPKERARSAPRVKVERKAPDPGSIDRPKSGSLTGRVWEICDSLAGKGLDKKALKLAVLEAGRAESINESTISVQFGKWFAVVGSTLDQRAG